MFKLDDEFIKSGRSEFLTKEEVYMLHAMTAALNSEDPSTQVGVCYVSEDGKVLSVGCNSIPPYWSSPFPWGSDEKNGIKNTKYPYVIHAEMEGMTNYKGSVDNFKDGTLYVTLFPCTNCAKLIASLKIKRLVYLNAREDGDDYECANILFEKSGIECVKFIDVVNSVKSVELDTDGDEKSFVKIRKRSLI